MSIGRLDNHDRDINDPRYQPYGEALETFGLEVRGAVNGLGLVTRGLIWQFYSIWTDNDNLDGLTTTWNDSNASITTTWTEVTFPLY